MLSEPQRAPGAVPARVPMLVMLPGLDGMGKRFGSFIAALGADVAVEIVRYPEREPLGYAELEHYVRAALPRARRFVLLAESFSGPLGIRIAASPPPELAGLILVSSFARYPLRCPGWAVPLAARLPLKSLPRWLRSLVLWGSLDPTRAPRAADRSMATVSREVLRHRMAELLRVDEREHVRALRLPAQLITARGDLLLARRAARRLAASLLEGEHIELEGPHALLQARPAACAQVTLQFMRRWL